MTYSAAMTELQQILQKMESAPEELEHVIVLVKRADELMRYCKAQLEEAAVIVNDVLETGYAEEE
jgi:exodeoxyribonuclease VII small subunit